MGKKCIVCGNRTMFYDWTSSRDFPVQKLIEVLKSKGMHYRIQTLKNIGFPVCFPCKRELEG